MLELLEMGFRKKIKDLFRSWVDRPTADTPSIAMAEFHLKYRDKHIATLSRDGHEWWFRYCDDYPLRPLVGFPDTKKAYHSRDLWPFFVLRLPSMKQAEVREILEREKIDPADEVLLLRRFGRRTIANQFELIDAKEDGHQSSSGMKAVPVG